MVCWQSVISSTGVKDGEFARSDLEASRRKKEKTRNAAISIPAMLAAGGPYATHN